MLSKEELNCSDKEYHLYKMRGPQLKAMHNFMCNSNYEEITMSWLEGGVPDGADEYDYFSISIDNNLYKDICDLFKSLVNKKGWEF